MPPRRRRTRQRPDDVIAGRTRKRAKAVATDLRYGAPLCPKTTVVDGEYDGLAVGGVLPPPLALTTLV